MYDLSIITDALRQIIHEALMSSPVFGGVPPTFSVNVTGQHPQQPPSGSDCDLNLYLFHVTENKYLKNSYWTQASITGQPPGPARQPIAYEPLCLDLYYILTAQAAGLYSQEQQVMSVAMRALHEYGIVHLSTPTWDGKEATSEVSLSLESPSWDELSRLWQAMTVPMRMSAQYRAGVAMLMPESGLTDQKNPTVWTIAGQPGSGWDPTDTTDPILFGTSRRVTYKAADGSTQDYDQSPATPAPAPTTAAGQNFLLRGRYLKDVDAVYLVEYGAGGTETETDVTATWKQPLSPPYSTIPADGVPFSLRVPPTPPGAWPPGGYGLRVGQPSDPTWRSATVPLLIAPWVDPTGGPLLSASGGVYTVATVNVPATGADVFLGTVPLSRIASGTPAAGQWVLSGSTVTFAAPTGMAAGNYPIRVRAANVESDPALWVVVA